METLSLLGVALGFATLSGINLYLTTFLAGMAIRFNWVNLADKYETLAVLENPWIIGVAGVLFLVEFFADKIPWLDSSWDAVHTFIRPIGGTLLALTALGEMDPAVSVIAALLGGGTTLITHASKAGGRLLINMSPEPVSNTVASLGEDGLVLGGLGLMAGAPVVAFFVFLAVVILAVWLSRRTWAVIRKGIRAIRKKGARSPAS
ncbi:DUF4126 domain-containing protein [Verrucomicrobiaceae bacterium R5-34]|uniref:DUF4126 domain-containing protein n=1 Tax=Oceaniferula flava TaxID=2800421 RepID=A0AAE2SG34_9BACT|nr:DUF4126 domain-containing protein [Oceaniferula flavus]MBK1830879.1 DUF4126 domain-containing protein [Verrucomicrobiaceae bacterium R5-34]MBK1855726.1 DUF4126 domain-containing protein [Oceaniferula flavus]MBM1137033.1 DUF4126 domain-containing protein [Oceaniferula flavus]